MKNNFEKTNYPYDINKLKSDLRSYSQKACDYINCLTKEAGAGNEKFVQNTLLIIRGFPYNHALIDKQVMLYSCEVFFGRQKISPLACELTHKLFQRAENLPLTNK